jgi:hypothetical protein
MPDTGFRIPDSEGLILFAGSREKRGLGDGGRFGRRNWECGMKGGRDGGIKKGWGESERG